MTQIVLSIGSNIERKKNIQFAISSLQSLFGEMRISPVYEAKAIGFDGPDFLNLVVVIESDFSLDALIDAIQKIELDAGRVRGKKASASRNLDVDVLLFGDGDFCDKSKNIPRDEIIKNAYVLKPLADVLPNQRHPINKTTFGQMWVAFQDESQVLSKVEFDFDKQVSR